LSVSISEVGLCAVAVSSAAVDVTSEKWEGGRNCSLRMESKANEYNILEFWWRVSRKPAATLVEGFDISTEI
jgi:hypothetical protein